MNRSPETAQQRGYEIVAHAIRDTGLTQAFGLLGDANLAAMAVAIADGLPYAGSRHESGAVCMAAGHAWATGSVGFATITRGPALSNSLTALTSAARDSVPLVLLAGDKYSRDPLNPQAIDQEALVRPTGAEFVDVTDPAYLRSSVFRSFELAAAKRRPVVLNIKSEMFDDPAPVQENLPPSDAQPLRDSLPEVDEDALSQVAARLSAARRPVIVAGQGALAALESVKDLSERMGALLSTTLLTAGAFRGHPYSVGVSGGYAVRTARELLQQADVVLAVGASMNSFTTSERKLFRDAFVIQVDRDETAIGRHHRVDIGVLGDSAEVVSRLAAEVQRSDTSLFRTPEVEARIATGRLAADVPTLHDVAGLDPRGALRALDKWLPSERRILVDVGHFASFPCQSLTVSRPGGIFPVFGYGSVGLSLPTAIGVAAAGTGDAVVAVVGDGGLLMSLPELETLGRLGLPLAVLVMDDSAYGAEVQHLRAQGFADLSVAQFPSTDFVGTAAALGVRGVQLKTPDQLEHLDDLLGDLDGPLLVDVRINPAVVSDKFQQHIDEH